MALHDDLTLPTDILERGFSRRVRSNVSRINHQDGRSQRVVRSSTPRYSYTATMPALSFRQNIDLINFYIARHGWRRSFNFLDQTDMSTAADDIGVPTAGDVVMTGHPSIAGRYYIDKKYYDGVRIIPRRIVRPFGLITNNPGMMVTYYSDGSIGLTGTMVNYPPTCGCYFYTPVNFSPQFDLLETSLNGPDNSMVTLELLEISPGEFAAPVLGSRATFGPNPGDATHPPGDEPTPDGGPPITHDNTQPPVFDPADCGELYALLGSRIRIRETLAPDIWGAPYVDLSYHGANDEGWTGPNTWWIYDLDDGQFGGAGSGYIALECSEDGEGAIWVQMHMRSLSYVGHSQLVPVSAMKTTEFDINITLPFGAHWDMGTFRIQ